MCLEDVRLARETDPQEIITNVVDTAVSLIVPQEWSIFSLEIDNQGPDDVTISLNPAVTAGNGIRIQPGDPPKKYTLTHSGNLITRGIYAITAAAKTAKVVVWMATLQRK